MAYPTLQPASRNFSPGNYPVKTFRSQSGAETRLLYGNQRSGMTLELQYENISDSNAELFVTHFDQVLGTYQTFSLPAAAKAGWNASASTLDVTSATAWRYAEEPSITSVRPGLSTVQVKLIGVL